MNLAPAESRNDVLRVPLRLKRWLRDALREIADEEDLSLNRVAIIALKDFVAKRAALQRRA